MKILIENSARESTYELVRIIAQVFIVFYHILLFAIWPISGEPIYKAIWVPFHIGVPLFILLSGYFGIKPSIKGLFKIIGMAFILQMPLFIHEFMTVGGVKLIFKSFFCISRTPFWFIRTYVILYLLSPLLNVYLKNISLRSRVLLLGALFFVSDYIGTIGTDSSLYEGYNIVSFMLFYVTGNTIRKYKSILNKYSFRLWISIWLLLNFTIVVIYSVIGFDEGFVGNTFVWFFFSYTSPGLLINSVLFFIAMGKLSFKSGLINKIAKASLAIYIIHGVFLYDLLIPIAEQIFYYNNHIVFVMVGVFLFTILVVTACTIIYWLLSPVWLLIDKIGKKLQILFEKKLDLITNKCGDIF